MWITVAAQIIRATTTCTSRWSPGISRLEDELGEEQPSFIDTCQRCW